MLETASIAGGAVVAIFLSFVVASFAYVRWHQNKKRELLENGNLQQAQNGHTTNGHYNAAADVVDASCCCQQSQVMYSSQVDNTNSTVRNGDSNELQHPQQHQFVRTVHHHEHVHRPPMRPFGPHHDYQKITMSDAILHR